MESLTDGFDTANSAVEIKRETGNGGLVVVCEHASNYIPNRYNDLGVTSDVKLSHVAWDIGAYKVAEKLSQMFDSPLVASKVSRLVYDCNRPPDSPTAMPEHSEVHSIPGNNNLSSQQKEERIANVYKPFHSALSRVLDNCIKTKLTPILITIHSFTPVYNGNPRSVQLGLLHDTDARLAHALKEIADDCSTLDVQLNQPYGPQDGVTHTLQEHALPRGLMNVMIEISNELLQSTDSIDAVGDMLCGLVQLAIDSIADTVHPLREAN